MINNIVITGGTGFIGSHIVEILLKNGFNIVLLKRSSSNLWRIKSYYENLTSFDIDTMNIETIFQKTNIDAIIHLATFYEKFHKSSSINQMFQSNIVLPTMLIDIATKYNVKYFINTGSFFECDNENLPIKEECKKKAFNLYAATKISFE